MRYPLGQALLIGNPPDFITVTDTVTGALVTPTTTTTTLLRPDGTLGTPYTTPTTVSVGKLYQAVPASDLTQLGPYQWKLQTTGPGAGVWSGSFDVYDPFDVELISVEDAKAQLEKLGPVDDAELELYVTAVTQAIEGTIGPCSKRTITEVWPGGRVLQLNVLPVVSVTSISGIYLGTPVYATVGLVVDPLTGIVRAPNRFPWVGPLTVVYVAGRATIPAAVQLAARMLLQHLWETKRGGTGAPNLGPMMEDVFRNPVGSSYLWPNRVRELLEPFQMAPAVA